MTSVRCSATPPARAQPSLALVNAGVAGTDAMIALAFDELDGHLHVLPEELAPADLGPCLRERVQTSDSCPRAIVHLPSVIEAITARVRATASG